MIDTRVDEYHIVLFFTRPLLEKAPSPLTCLGDAGWCWIIFVLHLTAREAVPTQSILERVELDPHWASLRREVARFPKHEHVSKSRELHPHLDQCCDHDSTFSPPAASHTGQSMWKLLDGARDLPQQQMGVLNARNHVRAHLFFLLRLFT